MKNMFNFPTYPFTFLKKIAFNFESGSRKNWSEESPYAMDCSAGSLSCGSRVFAAPQGSSVLTC